MAGKYDARQEILRSLSEGDFRATLDYYGIRVQKNSILCPFHNDRHYGSCVINKSGKSAKCFACGKTFRSVDLVMHYEGLAFPDAVDFLWEKVLGNPVPEGYDSAHGDFILSYKELAFIGLYEARGRMVPLAVNCCQKDETIPQGLTGGYGCVQDDGSMPVFRNGKAQPLEALYRQDPETALSIMYGKAEETKKGYERLIKEMGKDGSGLSRVFDGFPEEREEFLSRLQKDLKTALKLTAILRKASRELRAKKKSGAM